MDEAINREVKFTFVGRALAEYGQRVIAAMAREIKRQKVEDTKALLNSLSYKVYRAERADGTVAISFEEHGRFVDMGVGRKHPLSSVSATKELLPGIATRGRNKATGRFKAGGLKNGARQPRKIYSPIAYGNLNGLIGDLAFGFTDAAKASIKDELLRNGLSPTAP